MGKNRYEDTVSARDSELPDYDEFKEIFEGLMTPMLDLNRPGEPSGPTTPAGPPPSGPRPPR